MLSVAVLISGTGSNLRALLEAASEPGYPARVVAVGADRDATGLAHATEFGVETFTVPYRQHASREEWGAALAEHLRRVDADLIVLSGLMRLLPADLVEEFSPRIINTHPAFLPEFPGAHGVRDALAAGASQTGASVIIVDNGVDSGPILAQERIPVLDGDDEATLHERIKPVERRLLIDVVRRIAEGDIDLAHPVR
ncbi:phosphoribosylglycinamide formyltransferase [Microbacterium oryzae]|uniref:phosphoribosylglycinamide formyltransferase n=1 Tax=Microbacterium oryzae TaxID=743009 RepID=UPI0025B1D3A8|nr:phosphoribosylglycinamide formyltransferase [Microbacterium oryzae]MDN3310050.1 phosphoribosylglycinamide formyltransferase [Microbacterium oryzae]